MAEIKDKSLLNKTTLWCESTVQGMQLQNCCCIIIELINILQKINYFLSITLDFFLKLKYLTVCTIFMHKCRIRGADEIKCLRNADRFVLYLTFTLLDIRLFEIGAKSKKLEGTSSIGLPHTPLYILSNYNQRGEK